MGTHYKGTAKEKLALDTFIKLIRSGNSLSSGINLILSKNSLTESQFNVLDASVNGDIVLVAEDTYYENINFIGKAITVASHFLIDSDTSHISNTIINGSQPSHPDSGSVVYFISGEDTTSVLCGFTITGGYSGIECHSGMKIINNKISGNSYYAGGGIQIGINSGQSRIVIEKNIISNNIATPVRDTPGRGGGIYMNRTNGSLDGRISNNFISQNIALTSGGGYGGRGGGIYIRNCSPLISNNIIVNNTLEGEGGGVYLNESNSLILNNLIGKNILVKYYRLLW